MFVWVVTHMGQKWYMNKTVCRFGDYQLANLSGMALNATYLQCEPKRLSCFAILLLKTVLAKQSVKSLPTSPS